MEEKKRMGRKARYRMRRRKEAVEGKNRGMRGWEGREVGRQDQRRCGGTRGIQQKIKNKEQRNNKVVREREREGIREMSGRDEGDVEREEGSVDA